MVMPPAVEVPGFPLEAPVPPLMLCGPVPWLGQRIAGPLVCFAHPGTRWIVGPGENRNGQCADDYHQCDDRPQHSDHFFKAFLARAAASPPSAMGQEARPVEAHMRMTQIPNSLFGLVPK
jgi:hypothetical protein